VGQHVELFFDTQSRAVLVYLDASRLVLRKGLVGVAGVLEISDLKGLSGGGHIRFGMTQDGALRGAYGAWILKHAPRTELVFFEEKVGMR
jgi:hypothetical protein